MSDLPSRDKIRQRQIYKVTLVGSVGNVALLAFKFAAGILGHSAAMIADAVHSLSDFITDIVVLAFVSISAKPQDASHDYGHGKYEAIATLFIGLALLAAAISIMTSGALKLAAWIGGEQLPAPGMLALWAALASIVVKELLYRYTVRRGRELDSQAVVANAWHHRSDALSSIGAAIGIGGAILLGHRWTVLDPVASIVVGAMLVKVTVDLLKGSIGELTDHSLSGEVEQEIENIICAFPDVSEPHNLRTRRIGNRIAIEVHVRMDGNLPLWKAHEHASAIEQKLRERFGEEALVTLHMEPTKQREPSKFA
ncbi:MAG: cation diffusion facilitator family transporter [Bacteroidaceae bacterium]|nr:cation diffusion facilitator family transporter [Bacteroidaceae bacterium]